MTNEERRAALNFARREALRHATEAEASHRHSPVGPNNESRMAMMWSRVADAMKDGDPVHDSTDGTSVVEGVLTR